MLEDEGLTSVILTKLTDLKSVARATAVCKTWRQTLAEVSLAFVSSHMYPVWLAYDKPCHVRVRCESQYRTFCLFDDIGARHADIKEVYTT